MDDDARLVRPATAAERSDRAGMHAANRAAWDEAAERYEGWFDEAVALIRSGGTNLFGVEIELIGDLHGRCRRAIHLQCAGGRDTLSLWNQGADEVVGVDFSPRMLDLAARLTAATGAPARWILSDVLDTPHELDGTADLVYTGRGSLIWLAGPRCLGGGHRPAPLARPGGSSCSRAIRPSGCSTPTRTAAGSPPTTTTSAAPEASKGWAPEYIDRLSIADADQSWKFARAWTLGEVITALLGADLRLEARRRVPDRLVGRPRRRPARGARPGPAVVLGHRSQGPG